MASYRVLGRGRRCGGGQVAESRAGRQAKVSAHDSLSGSPPLAPLAVPAPAAGRARRPSLCTGDRRVLCAVAGPVAGRERLCCGMRATSGAAIRRSGRDVCASSLRSPPCPRSISLQLPSLVDRGATKGGSSFPDLLSGLRWRWRPGLSFTRQCKGGQSQRECGRCSCLESC